MHDYMEDLIFEVSEIDIHILGSMVAGYCTMYH
jgi:hypothetical protein